MRETVIRKLRKATHWRFSGVIIPFFSAGGIGLALADRIRMAYLFFGIACLWSVAYWLASDFLRRRAPKPTTSQKKQNVVRALATRHRYLGWQCGVSASVLVCFGAISAWTREIQIEKELEQLAGRLLSADEPNPPDRCGSRDGVTVMFGDAGNGASVERLPATIMSFHRQPVLSLVPGKSSKDANVILQMRSEDNKIVIDLGREGFIVNPNNYLEFRRPDRSTLYVVDQPKRQFVYIRMINDKTFLVKGSLEENGTDYPLDFAGSSHVCVGATRNSFFPHGLVDIE